MEAIRRGAMHSASTRVSDRGNPALAWDDSPCSSCAASPCCTHLPVHEFTIHNREDFSLARGLVNRREISLGLKSNGNWTVYWKRVCRHLQPASGTCGVHGLPQQSAICRDYDPCTCWYRPAFFSTGTRQLIRFGPTSLALLEERCIFDLEGSVYRAPDWDEMIELATETIQEPGGNDTSLKPSVRPLLLPPGRITRRQDLDLILFRLGFPGVSLITSATNWAFAFVPGTSVAPLEPSRYDDPFAMSPDQATMESVGHDEYEMFVHRCRFDSSGRFLGLAGEKPPAAA